MTNVGSKTIVLITGANTGLGFEIAKALFARPEQYHILIGCRGQFSRADDAIKELQKLSPHSASTAEPLSIDISSDESIAEALERVQKTLGYIDILVNNAGADFETAVSSGRLTKREAWSQTWDVNVSSTHLFTEAFAPLLLASKTHSPRLLFITSGLASATENASGSSPRYALAPAGWPKPYAPYLAYRSSKSGLNLLATEWARLLYNDGVKVFNISPGFLNTGLGDDRATSERRDKGAMGALDPAIGGEYCADVVEGKLDEKSWPIKTLRYDMVQPW
ncbi:dehydrogenase with different specificitie [Dothidotthia symphoricarpi CBS 119687]|uniref:Dehydrogenase with different specificitie n=1 Tax=Dothidotthia symphoricarpi CBS 119687 TaxID=1392245 RepID=A0A6A6ARY4_9PLEO|nr:dehydrogenase with different specificitie [Dothidotthia symphoricarpi CBS 119687]KAF2134742.1 dehydrogenase with different specificitie [Dothidotthia symphoricarpi CBS 119687]